MATDASVNGLSGHTITASGFLNTLGVDTHIPYTDGGYANLANDAADLAYLGITNVRDGISNGANGSAPLSSFITLAKQGIKFTFVIAGGGAVTTASLRAQLALIDQVNEAVPGSVVAVEGANEINNFPITFNGVGGEQGALNLQSALYSAVHSDPNLSGVAVDYFTGYGAGSDATGPNPTTTAGLADYDTQHPYPNGGQAPEKWVTPTQALGNESAATGFGPAVFTETGYTTNGGTSGGVNADVQAKYTLDLLLDDAANGISRTYLYQLMDAYKPGSPQGDDGYGLFDPSNAPKEAATAIHDLVSVLADPGAAAASFTPTPLAYSVTGLPATGNSVALEKSNGAYDIAVWNEPRIWNEALGTEITAASTPVTVQLGRTYGTVEIFDPLVSATAISTLTDASSVKISVTDHPLIIQVANPTGIKSGPIPAPVVPAPASVTVGSGPDTIGLEIAEDAYLGNARFTISIDGKQVGGTQTAQASHAAGQSQDFRVEGRFGAGQHTVTVDFLNDLYAGTSSTDRNLYVTGASFDGAAQPGAQLSLYSDGTQSFKVVSSTTYSEGAAGGTVTTLGRDTVDIGTGSVTIHADGPSTKVVGGAGAMKFIASSGNDLILAGSGASTVTGGSGTLSFTAAKDAAASITAGSGREVFDLVQGQAGGTLAISGFKSGTDSIHLQGYAGTGLQSEVSYAGGTLITLTDHTRIALAGLSASSSHTVFG
ncbi:carbohydrate-binding domain-containing protein [Lichenicoccus sp.]|uniref:carbohydrate-binding domain-containing protein n=1 Tax=Lichenicoccus sp. TaxID=2781899 RepID=UPI003D13E58C